MAATSKGGPVALMPDATHPIDAILGDTAVFISTLVRGLRDEHGIDGGSFEMDHVCFRCSSNAEYVVVGQHVPQFLSSIAHVVVCLTRSSHSSVNV